MHINDIGLTGFDTRLPAGRSNMAPWRRLTRQVSAVALYLLVAALSAFVLAATGAGVTWTPLG